MCENTFSNMVLVVVFYVVDVVSNPLFLTDDEKPYDDRYITRQIVLKKDRFWAKFDLIFCSSVDFFVVIFIPTFF